MQRPNINPYDQELKDKKNEIEELTANIAIINERLKINPKVNIERTQLNINRLEEEFKKIKPAYDAQSATLLTQQTNLNQSEAKIKAQLESAQGDLIFYTNLRNDINIKKREITTLSSNIPLYLARNNEIDEKVARLTQDLESYGVQDVMQEGKRINDMISQLQSEQTSWFVSNARIEVIKSELQDLRMRGDLINRLDQQINSLIVEKTNNTYKIAEIEERIPKATKEMNAFIRKEMESKIKGLSDSDFKQMSNITEFIDRQYNNQLNATQKLQAALSDINTQQTTHNQVMLDADQKYHQDIKLNNDALKSERMDLKSAEFIYNAENIDRSNFRNNDLKTLQSLQHELKEAQTKLRELEIKQKSYATTSNKTLSTHASILNKLDADPKPAKSFLQQLEKKEKAQAKADKIIEKSKKLGEKAAEKAAAKHKEKEKKKEEKSSPSNRPKN